MEDGDVSAMFSVMFFNGENEVNVGIVKVDPSLEYKVFQLLVSQKIGISPNQITIYLIGPNKSKTSVETRRRIPITSKANFSDISKVKNSSFLAVLKRSRKNRNRKPVGFENDVAEQNLFLPQRNSSTQFDVNKLSGHFPEYFHSNPGYNFQRQNMLLNLSSTSNMEDQHLKFFTKIKYSLNALISEASSIRTSCVECRNQKFSLATFHCCVNDAIIKGFRSPFGAISRPVKLSDPKVTLLYRGRS